MASRPKSSGETEMSNAYSTRYGQGWRECQQHKRQHDAFEGILFAVVAGAVVWAILGALVVTLWGVML
jgi:hypothetical protein